MVQLAASVIRYLSAPVWWGDCVKHAVKRAAIVGSVAVLSACASGAGGSGQSGPAASGGAGSSPRQAVVDPNAPVIVALLAPTTSQSSGARRAAQDLVAAAQMARSEFAPANMIMKIYDTKGTDAGAREAAEHAVRDEAALILGPLFAQSARVVKPVAAAAGVNVIAFSNDSTIAGDNVWVIGQLPGDEMRRLFAYAGSRGIGSVALAYPTNAYGEQVASLAGNAGRDSGVAVGPFVGYERSFKGIEAASKGGAQAIRGNGAQGVLIADFGDALRSMSAFLSYYDVSSRRVQYMGLSRWSDPKNDSERALQGGWYVAPDPALRAAFDRKFEARINRRPAPLAGVGYDAVAVAASMLRSAQAGGSNPFDQRAIANSGPVRGAMGPVRLNANGLNQRSLAVFAVSAGQDRVIDPAPAGSPSS